MHAVYVPSMGKLLPVDVIVDVAFEQRQHMHTPFIASESLIGCVGFPLRLATLQVAWLRVPTSYSRVLQEQKWTVRHGPSALI